jgi:hypothetical protein
LLDLAHHLKWLTGKQLEAGSDGSAGWLSCRIHMKIAPDGSVELDLELFSGANGRGWGLGRPAHWIIGILSQGGSGQYQDTKDSSSHLFHKPQVYHCRPALSELICNSDSGKKPDHEWHK